MNRSSESRRHQRHPIDCDVTLSWQEHHGQTRALRARGLDLSESGARLETTDPVAPGSYVYVRLEQYGFGGTAIVRHCMRLGARCIIGLELCDSREKQQKDAEEFIDYYELLQISPSAEMETIHRVYKILVARYHPDNPHTGDVEKFIQLTRAFDALSDPDRRAVYDAEYHLRQTQPLAIFELKEFLDGVGGENNRRLGVLCLLYNRRRVDPDKPGLSLLEFERLMSLPREHLLFTVWFLKEKGYIHASNNGDFMISADGVVYVESNIPSHRILYKLLRAPGEDGEPHQQQTPTDSVGHASRLAQ